MIVGHTKFAPDGNEGLIRSSSRRSKIYTYEDLVQTVLNSSENGYNICQPTGNSFTVTDSKLLQYRDWSSRFMKFFNKIPDITTYHNDKIVKNKPGMVSLKKSVDGDETEIQILNTEVPFGKNRAFKLPSERSKKGLSLSIQWYLYEQIRMHILSGERQGYDMPKTN